MMETSQLPNVNLHRKTALQRPCAEWSRMGLGCSLGISEDIGARHGDSVNVLQHIHH